MGANATDPVGAIRDQRRAAGMSQQRLAELAHCSVSYVRLLERGFAPASSDVLPRVLDALCPSTSNGGPAKAAAAKGERTARRGAG